MVTIDAAAECHDGVTLVTATVAGGDAPVRVTLESRLDGPVWPPRRQGEPAAGWTDDGFEGVVPADCCLALGFASPADPVDPPLELVTSARADDPTDAMDTPAAILRGLGDPTPPSLIDPEQDGEAAATSSTVETATSPTTADAAHTRDDRGPADQPTDPQPGPPARAVDGAGAPDSRSKRTDDVDGPAAPSALPPAVVEWLDAVESRVDTGEALCADGSVDCATRALCECGGVDGAREIDDRLSADAERLGAVEERVASLGERAEAASVATDALDRLA